MRANNYFKFEITIALTGIIYAMLLMVQNPQPFGKIALVAFMVFALTFFIRNMFFKRITQIVTFIVGLLFLILGTRSLLFNKTNEALLEEETEVVFTKLSFSESLKKAKLENKLMFVDFYTVWCTPCIKFHNEVLNNKKVASIMNQTFVNAKYNLYKGEGISLKETYNVSYVPRFLILDSNGTIIEDISTDSVLTAQRMIKISKKYLIKL